VPDLGKRPPVSPESRFLFGNVHTSQQVAFAVGVDPVDILTSGRATDVGHRTQVTLPLAGRGITSLRADPDDALDAELLSQSGSIAEELSARLIARFSSLGGYLSA
jgi:hypothetical protein